jgi:ABC-type xylose transport system substrate-binding protein
VISIDKNNVKATLVDSGYYTAGEASSPSKSAGKPVIGIVLPTTEEPRWIQDQKHFQDAFKAAGYDVEILFSQSDAATE